MLIGMQRMIIINRNLARTLNIPPYIIHILITTLCLAHVCKTWQSKHFFVTLLNRMAMVYFPPGHIDCASRTLPSWGLPSASFIIIALLQNKACVTSLCTNLGLLSWQVMTIFCQYNRNYCPYVISLPLMKTVYLLFLILKSHHLELRGHLNSWGAFIE